MSVNRTVPVGRCWCQTGRRRGPAARRESTVKLRAFGLTLSGAAALAAAVSIRLGAQPPAAPPPAPGGPRVQGVAGCAAAGCHNDQGPAGSPGSEYGAWV